MAILDGADPFGVAPELDYLSEPDRETPLWSETMFFQGWDPGQGVGFWSHVGRWPFDVDLWWSQMFVYLPDGQVVVDRSFGRPTGRIGPATGNYRIRCEEPGKRWSHHYDGAGELTSSAKTARGLSGAGRIATLRMDLDTTAIMPTWDLYKLVSAEGQSWSSGHRQQAMHMTGRIQVDDRAWSVDGMAYRDHSTGSRDWAGWGGNVMLSLVFPSGRVVVAVVTWNEQHVPGFQVGLIYENDRFEKLRAVELPVLHDLDANPRTFDAVLHRDEGAPIAISGELLHSATLSFVEPNENLNGVDLDDPTNPLALFETPVRFTWPDGEVGYGNLERNYRVSDIDLSNR
jgi:hypothetical protein